MGRLQRAIQKIFGESAQTNQFGQVGSFAKGSPFRTKDVADIQALTEYLNGWYSCVVGNNSPTIEDMNALFYMLTYQIAYLMQNGIAEWHSQTEYHKGQFASDGNGRIYYSTIDNNLGNALTDDTSWARFKNLENNSVEATHIINGAVDSSKLAVGSVITEKISDGAITSIKLDQTNAINFPLMPIVGGDKVIESSSNANGFWVKYSEGTMICYNTLTQAVASGATVGFTYTNPETFISKPMYQYTVNSQNGQTLSVNHGMEQNNSTNATIFVQNGYSGPLTIDVNVLAIGRWK